MPGPTSQVWWRESDGWWYSTVRNKQRRLVKGRKSKTAAQEKLRELLGEPEATDVSHCSVADVLGAYLDQIGTDPAIGKDRRVGITAAIGEFGKDYGNITVAAISQHQAREWLASKPTWSTSTQSMKLATVRAAFNWAVRVGKIEKQPFGKFHGPGYSRREHLPSDGDLDKLLTHRNEAYRDLITALVNTGCRPSEACRVEAKDVDLDRQCWIMTRHKNQKKKPSPRIIWLNATMLELTKRLMKRYKTGPLFRNTRGNPWLRQAVVDAFGHMRTTCHVDEKVTAYTLRHWYVTRALANGVDITTVSAMCGTSVKILQRHYSHLMQVPSHMLAAVERASEKCPKARIESGSSRKP